MAGRFCFGARVQVPFPSAGSDLPLVTEALARELLDVTEPDHQIELRSFLTLLETDVHARLDELLAGIGEPATAETIRCFHSLKGSIGSFSLQRCAAFMAQAEMGWAALDAAQRRELLHAARRSFGEGTAELRRLFPYLAAQ